MNEFEKHAVIVLAYGIVRWLCDSNIQLLVERSRAYNHAEIRLHFSKLVPHTTMIYWHFVFYNITLVKLCTAQKPTIYQVGLPPC